jgi:hydrogenase expression/formation protein HypC
MSAELPVCGVTDGCITCGDVALPLTVVEVRGADAWCQADDGRAELVAIDFVTGIRNGDRVLVHAGVALERVTTNEEGEIDALRR